MSYKHHHKDTEISPSDQKRFDDARMAAIREFDKEQSEISRLVSSHIQRKTSVFEDKIYFEAEGSRDQKWEFSCPGFWGKSGLYRTAAIALQIAKAGYLKAPALWKKTCEDAVNKENARKNDEVIGLGEDFCDLSIVDQRQRLILLLI
jgi:hypothetical protein